MRVWNHCVFNHNMCAVHHAGQCKQPVISPNVSALPAGLEPIIWLWVSPGAGSDPGCGAVVHERLNESLYDINPGHLSRISAAAFPRTLSLLSERTNERTNEWMNARGQPAFLFSRLKQQLTCKTCRLKTSGAAGTERRCCCCRRGGWWWWWWRWCWEAAGDERY